MAGLPRSDGVVTLRAMRPGESEALVAGRDDEFHRWMGEGSPDPQPTAVIQVDGALAGWVDHDHDDSRTWLEPGEVNIGYHVFAGHRGLGIGRRGVRLLLDLLADEERYRTATFLIDAENEASLRVARAVGATERRRFDVDGRPQVLLAIPIRIEEDV